MKRKIYKELLEWKRSPVRKPLLLQGARQVGKTYCLERFGQKEFSNYHIFDFMENPALNKVFDPDLKPERILRDLGILNDIDIDINRDLVIFDEIQQCPKALTSLKYFAQELPAAYIAASGSLLGLGLSNESFPVGKISRVKLYPMNFDEFLEALKQERLVELISSLSLKQTLIEPLHQKIWTFFKYYMITGGLPEAVKLFREKINTPAEGFSLVRKLQKALLKDYIDDIAKHSGKIKSVKIEAVFKNIPIQLARESGGIKKFVFKDVLSNASRYSVLEAPIEWLIKAGLVIKVPICTRSLFPLQAYSEEKRFKLYMFDSGILGCMLDLSPKIIFSYNYGSYKGYFAENIVLTELTSHFDKIIYSWSKNNSEIEFLIEHNEDIIPIEVKAGINTKAKSLRVYIEKYSPKNAILFSGRPIISKDKIKTQLPLYLASKFHFIK